MSRRYSFKEPTRPIYITGKAYKELKALAADYKDIKKLYFVSSAVERAIQEERMKRQLEGTA